MQKTTHSLVEWFFLPPSRATSESENPTLKRRHDCDVVGSGGGGVYCEAVARAELSVDLNIEFIKFGNSVVICLSLIFCFIPSLSRQNYESNYTDLFPAYLLLLPALYLSCSQIQNLLALILGIFVSAVLQQIYFQ